MTTSNPRFLPLPFGDARAARGGSVAAPAGLSQPARARRAGWRVLQDIGLRRSRSQILSLALQIEASRPALAAQLRETVRRGWL